MLHWVRASSACAAIVLATVGVSPATAQKARNETLCKGDNKTSEDERVAACDALLRSGKGAGWIYFWRGDAFEKKGWPARAIQDYGEAIRRLDPKDYLVVLALTSRGKIYAADSEYDLAAADFDELIRLNPENSMYYFDRGNVYAAKGDYDRALADYDTAIRLDPKNWSAYEYRAHANFAKSDFEAAVRDFRKANDLRTHRSRILGEFLARAHLKQGGTRELAAAMAKIKNYNDTMSLVADVYLGRRTLDDLQNAPQDDKCPVAFYGGEWRLLQGDKDGGLRDLETAVGICTKFYDLPEYHFALIEMRRLQPGYQTWAEVSHREAQARRASEWPRVIELEERLLTMTPPDPENRCFVFWGLVAVYQFKTGEMQKAGAAADESVRCLDAVRKSPDASAEDLRDLQEFRIEALRIRGIFRIDAGRYDEAFADEEAQIALNTDPGETSRYLSAEALILERKGDLERARALRSRAIAAAKTNDKRSDMLIGRAFLGLRQGRIAEAEADLADALRAKPFVVDRDSDERAKFLALAGRYDEAASALKRDEQQAGKPAAYAYLRSWVEGARGNFAEAAAAMRKAEAQEANNASVLVAGYLARARSGQTDLSSLRNAAGRFDRGKWPDAAIFFVLGRIGDSELLARAAFGNPSIERSRIAFARFYIGEMALVGGDKEKARTHLEAVASSPYCSNEPFTQPCLWAKGELGVSATGHAR